MVPVHLIKIAAEPLPEQLAVRGCAAEEERARTRHPPPAGEPADAACFVHVSPLCGAGQLLAAEDPAPRTIPNAACAVDRREVAGVGEDIGQELGHRRAVQARGDEAALYGATARPVPDGVPAVVV